MTGDETLPGDDAAVRWWKRKAIWAQLFAVAGMVMLVAVAWQLLAGDEKADREANIETAVKSSMQEDFETDPRFAPYHLVVEKVVVLKRAGNQYQGVATVHGSSGITHQVPVDVTAEGENIIWRSDAGGFAWLALEQVRDATPVGARGYTDTSTTTLKTTTRRAPGFSGSPAT